MSLISVDAAWEYQTTANTVPPDPSAVSVPAGGWTMGQAPFGTLGSLVTDRPPNTAWAIDTGLWVRRNIAVDGTEDVLLEGEVENSCYIYLDGDFVAQVNPSNANLTAPRKWMVMLPRAVLTSGTHEVAILALDESVGGESTDATLLYATADYCPTLMPLQPQAPVRETLAWLTDVLPAEDGTEERLQLRLSPRQGFLYSYPASQLERVRAFNTVYGGRQGEWLVPVWTQAQLVGSVAAGLDELTAETRYSEFRTGSLVMLWQSPSELQVLGLDTVIDSDTLALAGLTEAFDNAWLMPVRRGYLISSPEKALNGFNTVWEMNYEVDDNAALTVAAPAQFLGDDIHYEESLLPGEWLSDNMPTQMDVLDSEVGLVARRFPWLNPRISREHHAVADGPVEAWALREWLHRRAGRFRQFWQPSFEADLTPRSSGAITTTLLVSSDDYRRHATGRTHIAVQQKDGTWLARTITAATQFSADIVQLTISPSLGSIQASTINRICFLGLKRLDTDRIEISWPGGGVCQTEARMMELAP